jgi:hypothetical protein
MAADQVPDLHQDRPHPARMYDYYLGGKDNYAPDREAAEKIREVFPSTGTAAHVNRAFMHRASRWLAGEAGIRQFLDIGTGIPTEPNLHQVVQEVAPESRVVYADNDPIVLAHARALMTSTPGGRTAYIHADATKPDTILSTPELQETLDLSKPVALSLIALLHFIPDEDGAYGIVEQLLSALPSGSALAISHASGDFDPETAQKIGETYRKSGIWAQARSKEEVERFFTGLELVEPGIVVPHRWRPDSDEGTAHIASAELKDSDVPGWVGVALKP